jgi:prepilin-type N-terminal cleavage/methylation domain-containing protein
VVLKMRTNLSKRQKGFTIIEVIIVLAIAGLILLIALLAIPALQRNQRNTGRKNDVGRVGAAATEFVSNRNGTLPVAADNTTIRDAAGTLSQYDFVAVPGNLSVATQASVGAGTITTLAQMRIVTVAVCDRTAPIVPGTVEAGSTRQMAIQYAVENSTSSTTGTALCVDI